MKRIIVTGGAGFIGSHLTERLLREGSAVTVLDNFSTGREENLKLEADFVKGDVSRPEDVDRLPMDGVVGVFHLAAQSSGEVSFEDPYADFQTNAGGTLLLLEWCKRNGIDCFIFASTISVYGRNSETPISENTECIPNSFYGIGKLASENYVRLYGLMGLRATVLRPCNVYGPMQNLDNMKQGMASIYMSFLQKGEPILVKGSLERFRDQVYVADVIDVMMLCLEKPVSIGQTYNIGTGRKTTVRELIASMLKVSGNSVEDYPVREIEGTPGDLFGCYADISKVKEHLGWEPRYDLESGLRKMYEYHAGKGDE